ncbi:MAG: DUF2911 domain-containing protein [Chitinophagaceae bacterium]|nr:DUF2911 domain-containing protein [Chitinophagaceae bacterium]
MRLLSLLCLCMALSSAGFSQLKTPAKSPAQTIVQHFALSTVEVSYSRPSVNGRTIFGDLVPYGKVWRTGANAATTISFGEEVTIGGKKIPAGKYGLLSIPEQNQWTIILTKQTNVTSPAAYKESEDVVRVKANVQRLSMPIETMIIAFDDIKANSMNLIIAWDRSAVIVPIAADVDAKVMSQINQLNGKENFPYFEAAAYYLESGKDLNKAVAWFDKAIEKSPNAFWIYYQKASALAKLGKKKDAISTANKSIEFAKEAKSDDYISLNEKLLASLR